MNRRDETVYLGSLWKCMADGAFSVDEDFRVRSFNTAAERITGISADEAMGKPCRSVLKASFCDDDCPLRKAMEEDRPVVNRIGSIVDSSGRERQISISAAALKDDGGKVTGGVETFRDISSMNEIKSAVSKQYACQDILSINEKMRGIFEILPTVAKSMSTVLVCGETGTGKEVIARAIHNLSDRSEGPFVAVNCGALPDALLESELFGYLSGAFTDARKDKPGRFALAEGGTIFLDEIGDVSPALQVRLLRVLQEKVYEPLGSVSSLCADVRVIAATNRDLDAMVDEGTFRRDLFYRLNVIRINLPSLRERREDIPLLAEHFIDRFNREQGREIEDISPDALSLLLGYDFPGNIRELENVIERAFVICRGRVIDPSHLPDEIFPGERSCGSPATGTLKDMEARLIIDALRRNGSNRTRAARELGIHKSTLYRKLDSLGIDPEKI